MISSASIVSASKTQISANLSDEVVILSTANGVYYGLNPVGAYIWQQIQEPKQVSSVLEALLQHYDVEESQCAKDLFAVLNDLAKYGLIEVKG